MNDKLERQSKVKDGNFYVVQSFMVKELKLKGLELSCYAIIYGFSQADDQVFTGSLQYLCDWTCSSKQAVLNALQKLVSKGLLIKKDKYVNGVKFVEYDAIYPTAGQENGIGGQETSMGGSQESLTGVSNNVDGGGQETSPNTLGDNTTNTIDTDTKENNTSFDKCMDKQAREGAPNPSLSEEKEKPNFYTGVLVEKGYLDSDDKSISEFNRFFEEMHDRYGLQLVTKCLRYFLERFESNGGVDENGSAISSRFAYMSQSIRNGLTKITANPNDPTHLSEYQKGIARSWGYEM